MTRNRQMSARNRRRQQQSIKSNRNDTMPQTAETTYNTRLENKLDDISKDVKDLSDRVLTLTVVNQQSEMLNKDNAKKIDTLEEAQHRLVGVFNLGKTLGSALITILVGFGVWIVSNSNTQQQDISNLSKQAALTDSQVNTLKADVEEFGKRMFMLEQRPGRAVIDEQESTAAKRKRDE